LCAQFLRKSEEVLETILSTLFEVVSLGINNFLEEYYPLEETE
jgi:hypothetical protein